MFFKKWSTNSRNEGFTLLEIILVVSIVGIIAAITYQALIDSFTKPTRLMTKMTSEMTLARFCRELAYGYEIGSTSYPGLTEATSFAITNSGSTLTYNMPPGSTIATVTYTLSGNNVTRSSVTCLTKTSSLVFTKIDDKVVKVVVRLEAPSGSTESEATRYIGLRN